MAKDLKESSNTVHSFDRSNLFEHRNEHNDIIQESVSSFSSSSSSSFSRLLRHKKGKAPIIVSKEQLLKLNDGNSVVSSTNNHEENTISTNSPRCSPGDEQKKLKQLKRINMGVANEQNANRRNTAAAMQFKIESTEIANKLFCIAFLGRRVRKIMKSQSIQDLKILILNCQKIILELCSKSQQVHVKSSVGYDYIVSINKAIRSDFMNQYLQELSAEEKSMLIDKINEYNKVVAQLHDLIFIGSSFRKYQGMIYLDLSPALSRCGSDYLNLQTSFDCGSEKIADCDRKSLTTSNESFFSESDSDGIYGSPLMPDQRLGAVGNSAVFEDSLISDSTSRNLDGELGQSTKSDSEFKERLDCKIVLFMISADKLMSGKKGGLRDSNGNILPDRKPGIRVTLLLPASSGNQNCAMRPFTRISRDYDHVTLNPQWNDTVELQLPFPRSILHSINNSDSTQGDAWYQKCCADLIQWWSNGIVKIHIIDSERFNDDIFMGEVNLSLSSMFISQRKKTEGEFNLEGTYSLNKVRSSDRVSGMVTLSMALYLPSELYVRELLTSLSNQVLNDSIISEREVTICGKEDVELDSISSAISKIQENQGNAKLALMRLNSKLKRTTRESDSQVDSDCNTSNNFDGNNFNSTSSKSHLAKGGNNKLRTPESVNTDLSISKQRGPSPTAESAIGAQRRSRIANITKTLEHLSTIQNAAHPLIESMSIKLEARKEARLIRSVGLIHACSSDTSMLMANSEIDIQSERSSPNTSMENISSDISILSSELSLIDITDNTK